MEDSCIINTNRFIVMKVKSLVLLLVGMLFHISALAVGEDCTVAVEMVSYEQDWSDRKATIALKNKTEEEIFNVAYRIIYLDMADNQMDYKDFVTEVNIASGMTRKVDIDSYEHDRNYSYYESDYLDRSNRFKVIFELKGYNLEGDEKSNYVDESNIFDADSYMPIMVIVMTIVILGAVIGAYVLVAVMAKSRNRNIALWVLLSIVASPLLIIIILLCIGKDAHHDNYSR